MKLNVRGLAFKQSAMILLGISVVFAALFSFSSTQIQDRLSRLLVEKGEEISHRRGGALSSAKTYYDLKDGKLHSTEQMLLDAAEELLSSIA